MHKVLESVRQYSNKEDSNTKHLRLRPTTTATEWKEAFQWSDTFTKELPGDQQVPKAPYTLPTEDTGKDTENTVDVAQVLFRGSRQVRNALWSWAVPERHENPRLVGVSAAGARLVGLSRERFWANPEAAAEVWSGNQRLPGSHGWAHCYGGHQFGQWAGQLGDGRAISLGEVVAEDGRWEIQLKGSGRTPYSRFGDGYAVRRSSIREYLAAEHLHALGIPSSRSLALVFTDRIVEREQPERGAVLTRLAPSWMRFGSFELPASRGDYRLVRKLADYMLRHHFADIKDSGKSAENRYAQLLRRVVQLTAHMVARWQAVGFCHGVMNTDNMSMLGRTIDYGPFAFLDAYNPRFICNHSDPVGRYAFDEQPRVALWNLIRLAAPLSVLIDSSAQASTPSEPTKPPATDLLSQTTVEILERVLNGFEDVFATEYTRIMRRKFGLFSTAEDDDSSVLIKPFLALIAEAKTDYTFAMRTLCQVPEALSGTVSPANQPSQLRSLVDGLAERSLNQDCEFEEWKCRVCGFFESVYASRLARDLGCVDGKLTSASSETVCEVGARMKRENPRFVLRNWVAEDVILRAREGEEEWIDKILAVMTTHAFDDQLPEHLAEAEKYAGPVPRWGEGMQCSCSS
ncbi:UPF0061-domain-containing protein [Coemansia reversa NRRL 1564]|uniref:Selenoprotein O n=1 Tax=Coemansia reversa (strain ATCC 12441 / NRRL 1564) TaxID=763665 RepID=A0A2G5BGD6_COERN|nr:UPF0061-domain-containing protein [Coemansia reversa NRRL 1564]|eukprot:PIA17767.1 UPF0061-domain-containing protein [Coemansia reversa NRRL 1564]